MFGDGSLSFHEFATREPLPLATVHDAVLGFLRDRDDVVLDGSQAVNAYVDEARMTTDIDVLTSRPQVVAEQISQHLGATFAIDGQLRRMAGGVPGLRVFQQREPRNRHLVDVRFADPLPRSNRVQGVLVPRPAEVFARKLITRGSRRGKPKSWTDSRDLAVLSLRFPELKTDHGEVVEPLRALGASEMVLQDWAEFVREDIRAEEDDDEFR